MRGVCDNEQGCRASTEKAQIVRDEQMCIPDRRSTHINIDAEAAGTAIATKRVVKGTKGTQAHAGFPPNFSCAYSVMLV